MTSPSYEAAIQVIIEARTEIGMSQRDLADRLGKPRSFISKIETRERRLDFVEFVALALALEVEPNSLMERVARRLGPNVDI